MDNLAVLHAETQRFLAARLLLDDRFDVQDPPATPTLQMLVQNSEWVFPANLEVDDYILLYPTTEGVGANPTMAALGLLGHFQFAAFKVVSTTAATITFQRVYGLFDQHTQATLEATSAQSYGSLQRFHYFQIPGEDDDLAYFLHATMNLADVLIASDPHLHPVVIPPAIPVVPVGPIIPPPAPINPLDVVHQIQAAGIAGRVTTKQSSQFARLLSFENMATPGKFLSTCNALMFSKPDGHPNGPAFYNTHTVVEHLKRINFDYARGIKALMCTATDIQYSRLILFDFLLDPPLSLDTFACPNELPLTSLNLLSVITRIAESIAYIWGATVANSIIEGVRELLRMVTTGDHPTLTVSDMLSLVTYRMHTLPDDPAFDTSAIPDGSTVEERCNRYFSFRYNDRDVERKSKTHLLVRSETDDGSNKKSRHSNPPGGRGASNAGAASAAGGGPGPNTRAKAKPAFDHKSQKDWLDTLATKIPALAGVTLPCLHWIAGVAPCAGHAACQKKSHVKDHVANAAITANMAVFKTWLKDDPLKRF